jgi:hypothetical protein
MVEVMACLGGRADLPVLAIASGQAADVVQQVLAPALAEVFWWQKSASATVCGSVTTGSAKPSWPSLMHSGAAACDLRSRGDWRPFQNCLPWPPSSTCP